MGWLNEIHAALPAVLPLTAKANPGRWSGSCQRDRCAGLFIPNVAGKSAVWAGNMVHISK
jgi:hypothetical protein